MAGKLTDIQIRNLRKVWEADPRPGVAWLVKEKKLPVTRQYLDKVAKTQGWKKIRVAVQELLTDKNVEKRVAPALKKDKAISATKKTKQPATTQVPINHGIQNEEPVGPLQLKEEQFVRAYVSNFNVVEASRMAHIGKHTGYALIKKDYIQKRIAELMKPRAEKLGLDADALMNVWAKVLTFDTNEIVQHRRHCCPFCYSEDGTPQLAKDEYYAEKKKHDRRRLYKPDLPEYPPYEGEWWDRSLPPIADCPNCHGEGEPEVWIADTRNLSPFAKYMYCGVEMVKGDLKVLMLNKERAAENLAKALGLFREKPEEAAGNSVTNEELLKMFEERMRQSAERNRKMCEERGLEIVDVEVAADGE